MAAKKMSSSMTAAHQRKLQARLRYCSVASKAWFAVVQQAG